MRCFLISVLFIFLSLYSRAQEGKGVYKNRTFFHLERYWDSAKVCSNPHKGWFLSLIHI